MQKGVEVPPVGGHVVDHDNDFFLALSNQLQTQYAEICRGKSNLYLNNNVKEA